MKTPVKFIAPLNEFEYQGLRTLSKTNSSARVRDRALSIILSSKSYGIDEIASILDVHRNSVSSWICSWENSGIEGLYDKPIPGRPPNLTAAELEIVGKIIDENMQSPKTIRAKIKKN